MPKQVPFFYQVRGASSFSRRFPVRECACSLLGSQKLDRYSLPEKPLAPNLGVKLLFKLPAWRRNRRLGMDSLPYLREAKPASKTDYRGFLLHRVIPTHSLSSWAERTRWEDRVRTNNLDSFHSQDKHGSQRMRHKLLLNKNINCLRGIWASQPEVG